MNNNIALSRKQSTVGEFCSISNTRTQPSKKLLITHEIHGYQVNGRFFNRETAVIDYYALCNYRYKVQDIIVIGRCKKVDTVCSNLPALDGEGVRIAPIPEPHSAPHIVVLLPTILARVIRSIKQADYYVVRLPGPTGILVALTLLAMGKTYGVECVGHASASFIQSRTNLKLKKLYGAILESVTRILVYNAFCVAYRSHYLQKLYPNKKGTHEWVFSGAQLDEHVATGPRSPTSFHKEKIDLIYVGRLQPEKGLVNLIRAFAIMCARRTKPLQLHIVGEGIERKALEKEAHDCGVDNLIKFYGKISRGQHLFSILDKVDLFILPSLTEGMPRALIEAMARGLPAIGSAVGGIPELLDKDCLFPPGKPERIAEKVLHLIERPDELARLSRRNFNASKAHWADGLKTAKDGFWNQVVHGCR